MKFLIQGQRRWEEPKVRETIFLGEKDFEIARSHIDRSSIDRLNLRYPVYRERAVHIGRISIERCTLE